MADRTARRHVVVVAVLTTGARRAIVHAAVLVLGAGAPAAAQAPYRLLLERDHSATAGSQNLLALHRALYAIDEHFAPTPWFLERNAGDKIAGIVLRLGKSTLIDQPVDVLAVLVQHEVFGHGARGREFEYGLSYAFDLPWPYGRSGGLTRLHEREGRITTNDETAGISFGGVEATAQLGRDLRRTWLRRGRIHYRETALYLIAVGDLSQYVVETASGRRGGAGNDVLGYLNAVNFRAGVFDPAEYALTLNDLRNRVIVNLLDPFSFYALYAYIRYLWSGATHVRPPMIPFGKVRYLPGLELGLAPFGSEIYWHNYLVIAPRTFIVSLRFGSPDLYDFGGLSVEAWDLTRVGRLTAGVALDAWHQPALHLGGSSIRVGRGGWGGSARITGSYELGRGPSPWSLTADLGAKTSGYVRGERLGSGLVLRVGLGFGTPGDPP